MYTLLLLALLPAVLLIRSVPAGALMHLRLTTPVGSYGSKVGDPVRAVVIAPVENAEGVLVPVGSELAGRVKAVRKVGLGVVHETAALEIGFDTLRFPSGIVTPVALKVLAVDNARERVSASGRISAPRATATLSNRVAGYIRTVLLWHPQEELALWAIRALIVQVPDPEIYYPAGTELTVAFAAPAAIQNANELLPEIARFAPDDHKSAAVLLEQLPDRTRAPANDRAADIVNLVLLGTREQVEAAFKRAGWTPAEPVSIRSGVRTIRAVAEGRGYHGAPMSVHVVNDASADLSLQKSLNDASKRHHVRIWSQPDSWNGVPVWVGAGTRDVQYAYLRSGRAMTHRIEPEIDRERDKIVHDLIFAGCVQAAEWLPRPNMPGVLRNATGDWMTTDRRVATIQLTDCASATTLPPDTTLRRSGNVWQRLLRREILSLRNEYMRQNTYWRSYEAGRYLVRAIRSKFPGRKDPDPCYRHAPTSILAARVHSPLAETE